MQKDTALVSILGIVEAVQSAQIDAAQNFNDSGLVVAALLFLVMTVPLTRLTDRLIDNDRKRRLAGTS
jgi:polar amino acid transport system permease protein